MTYPGVRRRGGKVAEGLVPPLDESVALIIAFVIELLVAAEGVGGTEYVDLNGMVDD